MHTALDTTNARAWPTSTASFGLRCRPGDERPAQGPDDADWIVLLDADGVRRLAVQQVDELARSTWPSHEVPMQLHIDYAVPTLAQLERHRDRALALGATVPPRPHRRRREPLVVLGDPAGHPFCLLVAP